MYCMTTVQNRSWSHRVKEELKAYWTVLLHAVLYTDVFALQVRTLFIALSANHSAQSTHNLAVYATNHALQTKENAMQSDWGVRVQVSQGSISSEGV